MTEYLSKHILHLVRKMEIDYNSVGKEKTVLQVTWFGFSTA